MFPNLEYTSFRWLLKISEWGLANFVHICAKLGQDNLLMMVKCIRWHCPLHTGLQIRGLSLAEHVTCRSWNWDSHDIEPLQVGREVTFRFFET